MIIGSVATYHWFPDARPPLDLDILTPASIKSSNLCECFVDSQWHDAGDYILSINKDPIFADPDVLFTMKVSHAHWDVKWQKTMWDIDFLKSKGAKINYLLYDKLFKVWTEIHGKKHVNMNQPMTEFFKDGVKRKYDHEELHRLVAFHDAPLHERLRPDLGTAWCSRELFEQLGEEDQYKTALEEILATAIERGRLTNHSTKIEKLRAVNHAYFKLVTSMTTGWFARFLILNRLELLKDRRELWTDKLNTALSRLSHS